MENMHNTFDELTKSMAQSVTRRAAFKKFGLGLAGMALACFGLANKSEATPPSQTCQNCISSCMVLSRASHGVCQKICKQNGYC
jgi:hypothetical protein